MSGAGPNVPGGGSSARANAFDLIRLLLALGVVYSHGHLLGGFGDEGFFILAKRQTILGSLAVLGFFGLSGFLVAQSFASNGAVWPFVRARLLRILPGLYFALVFTAFVIAPLISWANAGSYGWSAVSAWKYVLLNLPVRVGEWHVGGILHGLPYPESFNGSLWSLFPELQCYGLVLVLGLCGALRTARANLLLFTGMVVLLHVALVISPAKEMLTPTLLSLSGLSPFVTAFLVGMTVFAYREHLVSGLSAGLFWLLVAAALLKFGGWNLAGPMVLPLGLIQVAHGFRARLPVDLSYGIYLLHFPLLHLASAAGLARHGWLVYFTASLAAVLGLAAVSWFLVEKPALRLKRRGAGSMTDADGKPSAPVSSPAPARPASRG